jgi:hypothetical protein
VVVSILGVLPPMAPILVPATIRVSLPAIAPPSSCAAGGDGGPASR